MAFTLDFQIHGKGHAAGVVTVAGKSSASCADANQANAPFRFTVADSESTAMGVAAGIYERVGTNSSGQPVYAQANRGH